MRSFASGAFLLLSLFAFSGCESTLVEDQHFKVGTQEWNEANPPFLANSVAEMIAIHSKHEVLVAVLDSGVDYHHPDLAPHWHYRLTSPTPELGYDYTGDDGRPSYRVYLASAKKRDENAEKELSHGTHVAGLIAGIGSAQDRRIGLLPYRLFPISAVPGLTAVQASKQAVRSLRDAIQRAKLEGARIVNVSLGLGLAKNDDTRPRDSLKPDFRELQRYIHTGASDVLIVAAAGNEKSDLSTGRSVLPCQIRSGNILCVGSVNARGELSSFSNYGRQFIDLYAPGEEVVSTLPEGKSGPMSGTSMAAPYVSHVAARVLIEAPCLRPLQVIELLKRTADRNLIVNAERAVIAARSLASRCQTRK